MNSSHFARCFFVALLIHLTSVALHADDWYRWRGPHLNGVSPEKDWLAPWPAAGPKQLWKKNVGTGFSSMSVSEGRLYTMGNQNNTDSVFCFDAETGQQLWKHSYPSPLDPKYYDGGPSATPTVDGKNVFTFSRQGNLFCLDSTEGKVIWKKNIAQELGAEIPTWGLAGSALVEGNLLFLNLGSAGTALDKTTGNVIWRSGNSVGGYSTPVLADFDGQHCIVLFGAKSVIAVNPKDGKKIWEHPWKTSYDVNAAEPLIVGDKVFITAGYDHGCALLQIKNGKASVLWENKNLKNHINSSIYLDGFIYGFDGNAGPKADFKCIDFKTGVVKWSQDKLGAGALTAADGKLILLTDRGELIIAPATSQSFKPISRAQVLGGRNWTTPVLANGRIYCRNAKGDLVCLDVKAK